MKTKQKTNRVLHLTFEQIELIQQALGMAEHSFTEIFKKISENTLRVRCSNIDGEQKDAAMYYHKLACKFADLNTDIENLKFDN